MSKEYRKELRALEREIRKASRDQIRHHRSTERIISSLENECVKEIRRVKTAAAKVDKGTLKQLEAFKKRQAILTGRLS